MTIAQRFDEQFQKMLTETEFKATLPQEWLINVRDALKMASPLSLGVSGKQFKEITEIFDVCSVEDLKLNCYQFALLNNNLESRSAKDLDMFLGDYANLIVESGELVTKWKEQTDGMRDELIAKLQNEEKMKEISANGKQIFKPVKAQA